MKDRYPTEIILSRQGSAEPIVHYRLIVDRFASKPFWFSCQRFIGNSRHPSFSGSPNYYSLGIASKRMISRANRDLYEDKTLVIRSMTYARTALIVEQLPDYYEVKPDGKVRMIR